MSVLEETSTYKITEIHPKSIDTFYSSAFVGLRFHFYDINLIENSVLEGYYCSRIRIIDSFIFNREKHSGLRSFNLRHFKFEKVSEE
jgi:hypothetical protein